MRQTKAAEAAQIRYKDSFNSELIQASTQKARKAIVLQMLKDGMQITAMGINVMTGANDARKWVSILRKKLKDYIVKTYPLRDRRVVYRLEPLPAVQPTLFNGKEVNHA